VAPPARDELFALAQRALSRPLGEAQATAWWERQLSAGPGGAVTTEAVTVEIAVLRGGRVGLAVTTDLDDAGLERAAAGAARLAAGGPEVTRGLPEPAEGREHDGYDARVLALDPAAVGAALGPWDSWRAAAARTAIVSGAGVRAFEERTFGDLRVRRHGAPGRSLELTATAVSPADLDPAALAAEAEALLGRDELRGAVAGEAEAPLEPGGGAEGDARDRRVQLAVEPGEYAVVLGPWAVAEVLRRAAVAFAGPRAPLADRVGEPFAAPCVNLSDSPRFAATLPRSFDADGAPRQPLPLIQDGIAHRLVLPGSGHAQTPGGAGGTAPEHLVLVGGGASDLAELAAPVERGLFIPSLSLHGAWLVGQRGAAMAEGVSHIRAGRRAEPAPNLTVLFEPFELLARVEALTARQRTIPLPIQRSARTAGATVCPALRAAGGLHVVGPA
jgi:predicted Zn-dependent protease